MVLVAWPSVSACGRTDLAGELTRRAADGPAGIPFTIDDVVAGDWTDVWLFEPYTDASQLAAPFDDSWQDVRTSISDHEGVCLLVFARGRSVVAWADVPRRTADYCPIAGMRSPLPRRQTFVKSGEDEAFPSVRATS